MTWVNGRIAILLLFLADKYTLKLNTQLHLYICFFISTDQIIARTDLIQMCIRDSRTSDAFRIECIYLCGITATPPHPEMHKTALGAEFTVDWKYVNNAVDAVDNLKNEGYQQKKKPE